MTKPNMSDPQVKKDIEDNKVIAAIGYIGILALVPLLLKPKSQYAKFHGKQGLVLLIGWVINMFLAIIPPLSILVVVILIILSILGVLKALAGEYWEMPYLADLAKKIKI